MVRFKYFRSDIAELILSVFHDKISLVYIFGEVQEWLNWLVSKTSEPATVPRVRIPLSPPDFVLRLLVGSFFIFSCLFCHLLQRF